MTPMPHISVVSPVYRAEGCVAELCRRLKLAIASITDNFEIILVEDRGPDNSWTARMFVCVVFVWLKISDSIAL